MMRISKEIKNTIPLNVPVEVKWLDATYKPDYDEAQLPGAINITYGQIIKNTQGFLIIASEVDMPGFENFGPRSISEIPLVLVLAIQTLEVKKAVYQKGD